MDRPSVAVLTPTFNHAKYIRACIESVVSQSRHDWEMVVIDDGSADDTAAIARSVGDPRVRVVSGRHRGLGGLGATYRAALDATSAPLLAILEGDDQWPPDKLARQLPYFERPNVVLAYGDAALVDDHGCQYATYRRRPPGDDALNKPRASILKHLVTQNFIVASTVVIRRTALDSVGGFWQPPGIPYVDHPTWMRLALVGEFAHVGAVVGHWRRHATQYTTSQAVGPHLDSTSFLREVVAEAAGRGLTSSPTELDFMLAPDYVRHARRAQVSALRLALLNGSYADAVHAATPLLTSLHPKWGALAVIGLAARAVGSDLEWIFRRTGKFSWPSRRHVGTHR